jgi:4-hydroxy-L-threonine phosphate dehydrogenase PdxA
MVPMQKGVWEKTSHNFAGTTPIFQTNLERSNLKKNLLKNGSMEKTVCLS